MAKVMKFIGKGSKNSRRKLLSPSNSESDASSPTAVAFKGNSAEELFNRHRRAFDEGQATGTATMTEGNIRLPFDHGEKTAYDFDITDEPSDGDYYENIGKDNNFCSQLDFEKSGSTNSNHFDHSSSSNNGSFSRVNVRRMRSTSLQRPVQRDSEKDIAVNSKNNRARAKSTGRTDRRVEASEQDDSPKKRKSKMEKILQLQEKNQRYKDEFRKVQKDRKSLKKELEGKKLEIASLTKEIDTHIAETSILKMKLSETLQCLDKTDVDERTSKSTISKLQKELVSVKNEYSASVAKISRLHDEIDTLKSSVFDKDEELKLLREEVSEHEDVVGALQIEIESLKADFSSGADDDVRFTEIQDENDRLRQELEATHGRASDMVKEREEAISELLRENEEIKQMVSNQGKSDDNAIDHEEFAQLRVDLETASAALEESQDRNVFLEEDLETWICKGDQMETELRQLRDDVEAWQQKAKSAEEAMAVVEASAQDFAKKASVAESALADADRLHKERLQEQEQRHVELLLDQKEKAAQKLAAAEKGAAPNPQEMMLQKAVADRKAKKTSARGSWGSVIQRVRVNTDEQEDSSDDQKKITELETVNADQLEEINNVKSEMVRLRSTYNDTLYVNKKRIEELEEENRQFAAKQKALELQLAMHKKNDSSSQHTDNTTVASF